MNLSSLIVKPHVPYKNHYSRGQFQEQVLLPIWSLYRKRVITRYLSFMEDLLYTISKVKLLEDILMPQPIVPVEIPQSRRFDSKKRNDILLKIRIGKLEVSFFQSLNLEMIEQLLDKVLLYDNSSI